MTSRIESLAEPLTVLDVSRETRERLNAFYHLFSKWSKSINIVAPSTIDAFWQRHIRDSLQIYSLSPGPLRWVDLGTGGGFPGIITAICLSELSDGWVHLVESNNKKAAFLRAAIRETGARATVHQTRAEVVHNEVGEVDRISSRALSDLSQLLAYSFPWFEMNPQVLAFFHKGRDYEREVDISRRRWQFDLVKHPSAVEESSWILEIGALSPKV